MVNKLLESEQYLFDPNWLQSHYNQYEKDCKQAHKLIKLLGLPIVTDRDAIRMYNFLMDDEKFRQLKIKMENKCLW